jgi:multicomponent Na+:H+ antiporter subunit E
MTCKIIFPASPTQGFMITGIRFMRYLPWLMYQILLANLHLLYLTFHPRMMDKINPRIIRFDSSLKSDLSRTTLANSITLTPGTITVYAGVMGGFAVHCIDDHSGQGLPGHMEKKISEVFHE